MTFITLVKCSHLETEPGKYLGIYLFFHFCASIFDTPLASFGKPFYQNKSLISRIVFRIVTKLRKSIMCTAISTVCTNVGVYTLYVHGYSKFMSNSDHNN